MPRYDSRLRMHFGIAVHFAGRGLQDLRPAAFGHAQHVDRAHHRSLHRLDRVVLVVARRGGAGQVVDLVDFQQDRLRDVVPNQLEVRLAEQVRDVRLLAGEEVVEADDVVPLVDQAFAEMRAEKPGAAGDEDAFDHGNLRRKVERVRRTCCYRTDIGRPRQRPKACCYEAKDDLGKCGPPDRLPLEYSRMALGMKESASSPSAGAEIAVGTYQKDASLRETRR